MSRRSIIRSHLDSVLSCGVLFLTVALAPTSGAMAALINVDFSQTYGDGEVPAGVYSGAAVVGTAGDTWNGLEVGPRSPATSTTYTSGFLVDSTNVATTATVTLTGNSTFVAYDTGPGFDNNIAGVAPVLMNDFAAASTGTVLGFAINGLTVGGVYDLYLYSQNGGYSSENSAFTINAVTKTATNSGNPAAFVLNNNYVAYLGLTATGGTISGTISSAANASINGFQLVPVAEPSSMMLAALSGIGLIAVRRRR
jgi:hypothetical protein